MLAIVVYDAWRPASPDVPALPQVPPEVPPTTRRMLDKTPLLYEGEYLQHLLDRLRPALVTARPEPDAFAVATTGFVADASGAVLVSLVSDAPRWQIRTAAGDVADGELTGVDAVHGLALIRTTLAEPVQVLPLASGVPLSTVEPLLGVQASAAGGEVRQLLPAGSVSSFDRALREAGLHPGELTVDADGRVHAFGASTESGAQPLPAYEIEEIVGALATGGRHPHPWLGATMQTIGDALRGYFDQGALVIVHVEPGSPAARAGLRSGGVLEEVRAGDRVARTAEGVENLLEVGQVLEFVPVSAPRATRKPVSVTVEDRQRPLPVSARDVASLGLMPAEPASGVAIVVAPGAAAASRGLHTGDVVEAVDLRAVTSGRQLTRALSARAPRGSHLVTIRRGRSRFFVLLGPADLGTQPSGGSGDA